MGVYTSKDKEDYQENYYFQNPDVGFTILLTDIFQFRPKNFKFLLSQIKMTWIWNTAINPWEKSLTIID